MSRFNTIGKNLDVQFQADLNENFTQADTDLTSQQAEIAEQAILIDALQSGDSSAAANAARVSTPYGITHDTLKDRVDATDTKVIEHTAQLADITKSKAVNESAQLGAELIDGTGWTSSGWTGDFTNGFAHTVGQTSPLTRTMVATGTRLFQVQFTINSAVADYEDGNRITVSIGNAFVQDLYFGNYTTQTYSIGIKSVSDGSLIFTPSSVFDGSLTNISVKEILTPTLPTTIIKDSTDVNAFEARFTTKNLQNVFLGQNAGKYNTTGSENNALGKDVLSSNTTGFWNVGLGANALKSNISGARNTGLGYNALMSNISGLRNLALGSFALAYNIYGNRNISLGSDSSFSNTDGNDNVSMGYASAYKNQTGDENIAIGSSSSYENISGNKNISIGKWSLYKNTVDNIIGIGYRAAYFNSTGVNNVAIGYQSLEGNSTGNENVAIGFNAGYSTPNSSISGNVFVGKEAGFGARTGANSNVFVGRAAGKTVTTGQNNILIGSFADAPTTTTSWHLNIGSTIFGDLQLKRIGVNVTTPTASLHLPAGTAAGGNAPLKLSAGVILTTAEAGAIEYDGTNLYFTNSAGVRKAIAVVA